MHRNWPDGWDYMTILYYACVFAILLWIFQEGVFSGRVAEVLHINPTEIVDSSHP